MTASRTSFRLIGPALIAALLASASAEAACRLNIVDVTSTQWRGVRGRGYDVYDPQRAAQIVTFRVQSRDGPCSYFATVVPASDPSGTRGQLRGPGAFLRYELGKDASGSQPLRAASLASTSEVFLGTATSDADTTNFDFVISMDAEQLVPPGVYQDDIEISTYEGSLGSGILRDRRRVSVSAPVPDVTEISFAPGTAFDPYYNTYTVNFAVMRGGEQRAVPLRVRSNSRYRLHFQSRNRGAMRHLDASDGSRVTYTMTVDGESVSLSGGGSAIMGIPTPAYGRTHILHFIVGEIGNASAGDYEDVISLSIFSLR